MNKVNLLYVEDEIDLRLVLDMALKQFEQLNYKVVSSAEEALEFLEVNPVDVLISDHYLPGIQGIELLETVKAVYPNITRFLITGSVMASVFEEARNRAEPKVIFEKPVIVDDIINKILEILKND